MAGRAVDRTVEPLGPLPSVFALGRPAAAAAKRDGVLAPCASPTSKLVYACTTYGLLVTAYSFVNIPYGSLAGMMTQVPRELRRARLVANLMAVCTGSCPWCSPAYRQPPRRGLSNRS